MDAISIAYEFRPHDHEECIEYIEGCLVLDGDETAVESSSEFDYLGCLPGCVEFFCGALELLAYRGELSEMKCNVRDMFLEDSDATYMLPWHLLHALP